MSQRTFIIASPHMTGRDIREWQRWLVAKFEGWKINYPLEIDGDYGQATRAATAAMCRAWGIHSANAAMSDGVTPSLRIKLREDRRTPEETVRFRSPVRVRYRQKLRARSHKLDVCYPVTNLITDANNWKPGHDGVDLICPWEGPALAIVTGRIVRADAAGWWGAGPKPSHGHPVSDGDGIVILESTVNIGPFRRGMHFCYGHAEGAQVRVGASVKAGQVIARIGWANAPHVHFMVNNFEPVNGFYIGRGDRDPKPFLDYAKGAS